MPNNVQSAMLDSLMGPDRNQDLDKCKKAKMEFQDPQVCKMFLCGFCPHELFVNTKADLGNCELIHDDSLRQEYIKSSSYQCMGYEIDFAIRLKRIRNDIDLTIRKREAKISQAMTPEATQSAAAPLLEKISCLQEHIDEKSTMAHDLGQEGHIEEACKLMNEIEKIEEEKANQEKLIMTLQAEAEKKSRICDVCGAFLVKNDPQHRLEEHLKGKLHSGAYTIREFLKSYDSIEESLMKKFRDHNSRTYQNSKYGSKYGDREKPRDEPLEAGELRHSSQSLDRDKERSYQSSSSRRRSRSPDRDRYGGSRSSRYEDRRSPYSSRSSRRSPHSYNSNSSSRNDRERADDGYRSSERRNRSPNGDRRSYGYRDERRERGNGYSSSSSSHRERHNSGSYNAREWSPESSRQDNSAGQSDLNWGAESPVKTNDDRRPNESAHRSSTDAGNGSIYDNYLSNLDSNRRENDLARKRESKKFKQTSRSPSPSRGNQNFASIPDQNLEWDCEAADNKAINMMDD